MKVCRELSVEAGGVQQEVLDAVIASPNRVLGGAPAAALRFLIYGRYRGERVLLRSGWLGTSLELVAGLRRVVLAVPGLTLESPRLGEPIPLHRSPLGRQLRPSLPEGTGPWEVAEARLARGDLVTWCGARLVHRSADTAWREPTLVLAEA